MQRIVHRKVALTYGFEFLYVPLEVMDEVETLREGWCKAEIWKFLHPSPIVTEEPRVF